MKKLTYLILVIVLGVMAATACSSPAPATSPAPAPAAPNVVAPPAAKAEKITIRMLTTERIDFPVCHYAKVFVDKVNAAAPDKVNIKVLGGPEVTPPMQQMDALRRGAAVDMLFSLPTYYNGILPEAMVFPLSASNAVDMRKNGLLAYQDQLHRQKLGVTILGVAESGNSQILILKKPISKADLTGLKIRGVALSQPEIEILGGAPVTTTSAEIYTAMQSGLIDGASLPMASVEDLKLHEVAKYFLRTIYPVLNGDISLLASFYDNLPKDVQKILLDTMISIEPEVDPWFAAQDDAVVDRLVKQYGLTYIKLSADEDAKLLRLCKQAEWKNHITDKVDAATAAKLETWKPK